MSPSERENRNKRMNDTTTRAKDDDKKNGHSTTTYYLYYLTTIAIAPAPYQRGERAMIQHQNDEMMMITYRVD